MNGDGIPDRADLRLLSLLQEDIPLIPRPWDSIATRAGLSPQETLSRISSLHEGKVIRSVSPILESQRLGLRASSLVAFRVPRERVSEVASVISSFSEVSHNFCRDHPYSIWFTISAETPDRLLRVIRNIQEECGISDTDLLNLPTVRRLKIDLHIPFEQDLPPEVPSHGY